MKPLHVFGAFIHGVLFFGHAIGVVYNLRRKHPWQAALHASVACYDIWATNKHVKGVQEEGGKS